jgi:hypothetical protein
MLNKDKLFAKLLPVFKSPIDTKQIVDQYSKDLLNFAVIEYEKWKTRSGAKYHSPNYFKKILQTNINRHTSKGTENNIAKENAKIAQGEAMKKNETLHEIISQNTKAAVFLKHIWDKLSENEKEIVTSRAMQHICYVRAAADLDDQMKIETQNCSDLEEIVEKFNNNFEKLLQKCILVEVRSKVVNGFYWKEAGIQNKEQIKFLLEV